MVGYLDLIKNGHDSPDMVKRSVGLMDHAINRMVNIIRQLGTIANNERLELATLSVSDLIDSTIERLNEEYEVPAAVTIMSELPDDVQLSANAETFELILGKLLINAWESYPKDSSDDARPITLCARIQREKGPAMLELKVIDKGEGIDPEVADTLFEPFITTKTSVGRGMGLTIARHTIRNLEGELQVAENTDGGVTATLTHPL